MGSIYWLCLTFWTNEFLGSYSNYKFIISFSIFNRMGLWRILCLQSYSLDSSSILFCWNIEKRKEMCSTVAHVFDIDYRLFCLSVPRVFGNKGKKLKEEDRKSVNNWCLSVFPFHGWIISP